MTSKQAKQEYKHNAGGILMPLKISKLGPAVLIMRPPAPPALSPPKRPSYSPINWSRCNWDTKEAEKVVAAKPLRN